MKRWHAIVLTILLPLGLIGVGLWLVAGAWALVAVGALLWIDNYVGRRK